MFDANFKVHRAYVSDLVGPANTVMSEMLSIELQYGTESSIQY